mmetsp:Transcript_5343/g.15844  ORF Transcript_5343/g.15844 Transcript_5343/m.15844 type:complete len:216 (-) Transcript_5343:234-881(-)
MARAAASSRAPTGATMPDERGRRCPEPDVAGASIAPRAPPSPLPGRTGTTRSRGADGFAPPEGAAAPPRTMRNVPHSPRPIPAAWIQRARRRSSAHSAARNSSAAARHTRSARMRAMDSKMASTAARAKMASESMSASVLGRCSTMNCWLLKRRSTNREAGSTRSAATMAVTMMLPTRQLVVTPSEDTGPASARKRSAVASSLKQMIRVTTAIFW